MRTRHVLRGGALEPGACAASAEEPFSLRRGLDSELAFVQAEHHLVVLRSHLRNDEGDPAGSPSLEPLRVTKELAHAPPSEGGCITGPRLLDERAGPRVDRRGCREPVAVCVDVHLQRRTIGERADTRKSNLKRFRELRPPLARAREDVRARCCARSLCTNVRSKIQPRGVRTRARGYVAKPPARLPAAAGP